MDAGYRTTFTKYETTAQRRLSIGGAEYGGNLVKKLCIDHLKIMSSPSNHYLHLDIEVKQRLIKTPVMLAGFFHYDDIFSC